LLSIIVVGCEEFGGGRESISGLIKDLKKGRGGGEKAVYLPTVPLTEVGAAVTGVGVGTEVPAVVGAVVGV